MDFYMNPQSSPPLINAFYDTECDLENDHINNSQALFKLLTHINNNPREKVNVFTVSRQVDYYDNTDVDNITRSVERYADIVYDNYFYLTFDENVPQNKKELLDCVDVSVGCIVDANNNNINNDNILDLININHIYNINPNYKDILCFRINKKVWKISTLLLVYPINMIGIQLGNISIKLTQKQRHLYKIKEIKFESKHVYLDDHNRRYMARNKFKVLIGDNTFFYKQGFLFRNLVSDDSFKLITDGDFVSRVDKKTIFYRNQYKYTILKLLPQVDARLVYKILSKLGMIDEICFRVLEFLYIY